MDYALFGFVLVALSGSFLGGLIALCHKDLGR